MDFVRRILLWTIKDFCVYLKSICQIVKVGINIGWRLVGDWISLLWMRIMINRYIKTLYMVIICLVLTAATAVGAEPQRFVQDRFAIGFWVDPPVGEDLDRRYAEIAEANFTLVFGNFSSRTPAQVRRQLELCRKYDMKALVAGARQKPQYLLTGPACWGYLLYDEPNTEKFDYLRELVKSVRKARPGHLAYINLYPNYANAKQLGADSYEEYVQRFADEVDVDVLSMDHYPLMRPGADARKTYCQNLEVMRKVSLAKNIPFWNFFNVMPFGPHSDPTEAQIRWQVFTSLVYGAKGVLYFCYWTPSGPEFPKGGAIITREGRRTRHYDQARRINGALKQLAPTLMKLTSTAVYRIKQTDDATKLLADAPIKITPPGEYLIGVFRHNDGRQAVLLNNYHFAYTAWPTVEFKAGLKDVVEICPKTGKEVALVDDSPAMEGLQLSLDAGAGRLFLFPAINQTATKTEKPAAKQNPIPGHMLGSEQEFNEQMAYISDQDFFQALNLNCGVVLKDESNAN